MLHVGDIVKAPGGHLAEVIKVGPCGWPRCPFGTECVTVQEDRFVTTTNDRADKLIRE